MDVGRLVRMMTVVVVAALPVGTAGAAGAAATPPSGGRIAGEWEPGISAADAGGRITVNGYGVGGLGFYALGFDDGSQAQAVCVQADVGHSMTAHYTLDAEPAVSSPELAVLLWRYAASEHPPATDVEAAALNVLSWRYAAAERRDGGPVWSGDAVEIAVGGHDRRTDVEATVATLAAEATARRGPWALSEPEITVSDDGAGGAIASRLTGPGGPIGGVEIGFEVGSQRLRAVTDGDGVATVATATAVTGRVVVSATGPGPLRTYSAPGSQRLAVPSAVTLRAERIVPPPTTTTTTTTTTTMPPSTTSTTTTVPPPTVLPTLPRTGAGRRNLVRWAAFSFAAGALAVLAGGVRSAGTARGPG